MICTVVAVLIKKELLLLSYDLEMVDGPGERELPLLLPLVLLEEAAVVEVSPLAVSRQLVTIL
jgi:hypothetical protein